MNDKIAHFTVTHVVGTRFWTVMAWTRDNTALGGDHHWLDRSFAEKAMRVYAQDPSLHGASESAVRKAGGF